MAGDRPGEGGYSVNFVSEVYVPNSKSVVHFLLIDFGGGSSCSCSCSCCSCCDRGKTKSTPCPCDLDWNVLGLEFDNRRETPKGKIVKLEVG